MNRNGRFRCGNCDRVLLDPDARRHPTRGEQKTLDATPPGLEKGRQMWELAKPKALATNGILYKTDEGTWLFEMRCNGCHIDYRLEEGERARRRAAAIDRGEDVVLLEQDRVSGDQ